MKKKTEEIEEKSEEIKKGEDTTPEEDKKEEETEKAGKAKKKSGKKKTAIILSVFLVIAAVVAFFVYEYIMYGPIKAKDTFSLTTSSVEDVSDVKLIAHRGFSAVAPENTLAAFEEACEAGFYACEFDIQLTIDKTWVVMHDPNLRKMTGVKGKIEDKTLDELRCMTITNGANIDKYENLRIPTLEETLALMRRYDIVPVIEIKTSTDERVEDVVSLLKKYGLLEKAWIISFEKEPLLKIRKLTEKVKISYLVKKVTKDDIDFCVENRFNGIDLYQKKATESDIKMILEAELVPQVWTVDKIADFEKFYSYGVRYFTGNCLTY